MDDGKRILIKFIEYEPLIDSSNMTCKNWIQMATDIKNNHDKFDGFVILHGTDTMAYTASALSFMCENLGKPIVLTGSQIPVVELRSDGYVNFISSLIVTTLHIPEVMLCFDSNAFRGCRVVKVDSGSFAAFESPNVEPLVKLGVNVKVTSIKSTKKKKKFSVNTLLCPEVAVLRLIPSLDIKTVKSICTSGIKGLIIESFGSGNGPTTDEFIDILKTASEKGVVIGNVTQCLRGNVVVIYAAAEEWQKAKVVSCGDMTLEAATTKLMFLLGQDKTIEEKRKLLGRNLRGEITSVMDAETALNLELLEKLAESLNFSTSKEKLRLWDIISSDLMCAAAKRGDIETLERLQEMGVDISSPNKDGRTALHVAAREGLVSVVRYLLEEGASVHQCDINKHTPLMDAIHGNSFDVIPLLLSAGATIPIRDDTVEIAKELCRAAASDDVDTIKSWRMIGVDLDYSDSDGRTALHTAVRSKSESVIKYLLDIGADPLIRDHTGKTPKDSAWENGLSHYFSYHFE